MRPNARPIMKLGAARSANARNGMRCLRVKYQHADDRADESAVDDEAAFGEVEDLENRLLRRCRGRSVRPNTR